MSRDTFAQTLDRKNLWIFLGFMAALIPLHFIFEFTLNEFLMTLVLLCASNIILGASLNLVNGWTGQFSLGHAGFMAVGAYSAAYITVNLSQAWNLNQNPLLGHVAFFAATIIGGLAAALAGLCVGLPSLRLKGDYLAVVTLGFSEIIRVLILNTETIGGARGFIGIPKYTNFIWSGAWVLITLFVLYRMWESRRGREWVAVREDEVATEAMGVSSTKTKVNAFVLSSFFAGVAGSLFAHQFMYLNPGSFTMLKTSECLIIVVLGGMGSLTGSVIAAVFMTLLPEGLRSLQEILPNIIENTLHAFPDLAHSLQRFFTETDLRMVIYSIILIVVMLLRPSGLLGRWEVWKWRRS